MYRKQARIKTGYACLPPASLFTSLLTIVFAAPPFGGGHQNNKIHYCPAAPAWDDSRSDVTMTMTTAVAEPARTQKIFLLLSSCNNFAGSLVFHSVVKQYTALNRTLKKIDVAYHLNYRPENKRLASLEKHPFSKHFFGSSFLLNLYQKWTLLHTRNAANLAQSKGYDRQKILPFFQNRAVAHSTHQVINSS